MMPQIAKAMKNQCQINEWVGKSGVGILAGELKHLDKTLSQCHFVHHKSHTDWPGIEPGPLQQ